MAKKDIIAKFSPLLQGKVELYADRVIIYKSSSTKGMSFSGDSSKTIFLSQLSGIELRKGGLTAGSMHFSTGGSVQSKKFSRNTKDNATIAFGAQSNKKAVEFKDAVEQQMASLYSDTTHSNAQNVSQADQLAKYKQLLDAEAITQDEYNAKKKQLLGL